MKLFSALTAALLLATLAVACGDDDDGNGNGDDAFRQVLSRMVLQISDVREGMQSLGGSYSTNEDAASGLGGGPTKGQLDAWGRILGYSNNFQTTQPSEESSVTAISTAVSVYETTDGASESFTDRVSMARNADWTTAHSDLTEFEQEDLQRDLGVDDMLWLHFTGYKEIGPGDRRLISDDQVVFRVDRAWGFIGAISTAASGEEDRKFILQQVELLALKHVERMRDGLKSEDLE